MEPDEVFARLRDVARGMGIVDISAARASDWTEDPLVSARVRDGCRPTDIMPGARSVVVIGIPIQSTIVDTSPSIYYNHLYGVVNTMLDQAAERLALELNALGFAAVYVPRDGYFGLPGLKERQESFFSHRHAAYLAGMGTFGYNNMLLTERNGPRIRFTSVITTADLPCGSPMDRELCIGCRKCTKVCPAKAVPDASYPTEIVNKAACVANTERLTKDGISPCGRCIAVCPVGTDRVEPPNPAAMHEIGSYRKPALK